MAAAQRLAVLGRGGEQVGDNQIVQRMLWWSVFGRARRVRHWRGRDLLPFRTHRRVHHRSGIRPRVAIASIIPHDENAVAPVQLQPVGRRAAIADIGFIGGGDTVGKAVGRPETIAGDQSDLLITWPHIRSRGVAAILHHPRLAPLRIGPRHIAHQVERMRTQHHQALTATAMIHNAVGPHEPQLADGSFLQQRAGALNAGIDAPHVRHRHFQAPTVGGSQHAVRLVQRARQRLFGEDVGAHLRCCEEEIVVLVRLARGDGH